MKLGDLVYDLNVRDLGIIIEKDDSQYKIYWWNPVYTGGVPFETTENHNEFAEHAETLRPLRYEAQFCLFSNKEKYASR
tara:strand:- start:199 stop:435 length:237 start_codon:yes stop_codon:yes gene_type:complete